MKSQIRPALVGLILLGAIAPAAAQNVMTYLGDRLYQPAFARSWSGMFSGQRGIPAWLADFTRTKNGLTGPGHQIVVEGRDVELFNVCKPHDCGDNGFEVMFSDSGVTAKGVLIEGGGTPRFFGRPNAAEAAALLATFNK